MHLEIETIMKITGIRTNLSVRTCPCLSVFNPVHICHFRIDYEINCMNVWHMETSHNKDHGLKLNT
jgi:hypothetical protein